MIFFCSNDSEKMFPQFQRRMINIELFEILVKFKESNNSLYGLIQLILSVYAC